jgi:hypothetical protein
MTDKTVAKPSQPVTTEQTASSTNNTATWTDRRIYVVWWVSLKLTGTVQ